MFCFTWNMVLTFLPMFHVKHILYVVLTIMVKWRWNMDINSLSTLISNIGVPCACLIATFYLWQKETDAHKEEMKNMIDALNNNTQAITKLTDHITGSDK